MEHFVTLFDSLFLPQGLALHSSLERHAGEYTLWILCVDDLAHDVLAAMSLPHVRLLRLSQLETTELLQVKQNRTRGEYCWTLTPFSPRFVFDADASVRRVTYLDADLWFQRAPSPILGELDGSGKSVLITDHAYSPEFDQSAESGRFCVQFLTFVRDRSEVVRRWWEERCIEWCFARVEDGKFGDQKYLDVWPQRFPDHVHVLGDEALALAPWNATRFPYGKAVFFHFHGLRLVSKDRVDVGGYPLPAPLISNVYGPYLCDIRAGLVRLEKHGFNPKFQSVSPGVILSATRQLRNVLRYVTSRLATANTPRSILRF